MTKKYSSLFTTCCRCVLCRAKILRLKQHHKGQHGPHRRPLLQSSSSVVEEAVTGNSAGAGGVNGAAGTGGAGNGDGGGVPQSVSNYSITRLSSSSSNHSFASGTYKQTFIQGYIAQCVVGFDHLNKNSKEVYLLL